MPKTNQTIFHYRIAEKIGQGGMGEVYQARDTKLERDAAIKMLPQKFIQDADRADRFQLARIRPFESADTHREEL